MSQSWSQQRDGPDFDHYSSTAHGFTDDSSDPATLALPALRSSSSGEVFMGHQSSSHGFEATMAGMGDFERNTDLYEPTVTHDGQDQQVFANPEKSVAAVTYNNLSSIAEWNQSQQGGQPKQKLQSSEEFAAVSTPSRNIYATSQTVNDGREFSNHSSYTLAGLDLSLSINDSVAHEGSTYPVVASYTDINELGGLQHHLVEHDRTQLLEAITSNTSLTGISPGHIGTLEANDEVSNAQTKGFKSNMASAEHKEPSARAKQPAAPRPRRKGAVTAPSAPVASDPKKWVRRQSSQWPVVQKVIAKLQKASEDLNKREQTLPMKQLLSRNSNGLFFDSATAAKASNTNVISYWNPPNSDTSIPATQTDREDIVKKLVKAIKNNKNCLVLRGDDRVAFLFRWGDDATHYTDWQIEALAWNILDLMLEIHEVGWSVPIPDPKQHDDICLSMYFTFAERMELVQEVLRISKPTCEALLKGNRLREIVGCPHIIYERIQSNKVSNERKADELKEGTAKRKRQQDNDSKAETAQSSTGMDEPQSEASRPRKKRKTTSKPKVAEDMASIDAVVHGQGSDIDAPHETGNEYNVARNASDAVAAPKRTPAGLTDRFQSVANIGLADSTHLTSTATTASEPTRNKRSISDVDAEPDVSAAKRATAAPRPKAPMKGKGKNKSISKDDSEYKAPPHARSKPTSSSSTESARATTRRRTPANSRAQSGSHDTSTAGSALPG